MKMNKKSKSFVAMYAILGLVYILLFALVPFAKPAGSWVMFVFSVISIAGGCGITLYTLGKDDTLMSKFYGYPIFKIGIGYTLVQLGVSVVVYAIGAFVCIPYWVALLVALPLAGAAGIGIIAAENARDFIEKIDEQTAETTRNITYFRLDLSDLLELCEDETLRPALQELANKSKYSDPVSIPATAELEQQIKLELSKLHELMQQNESQKAQEKIQLILRLLASRNRLKITQ